jgi:hypothetical protein
MTDTGPRLQALFDDVRADDRRSVTAFGAYEGRIRLGRRPRVRVLRVAIAASVLAAAVLVVPRAIHRAAPTMPIEAIMAWRAPSDVLLVSASAPLFGSMPGLGESSLDAFIPTHSTTAKRP